jgi:dihydrofolate reductase
MTISAIVLTDQNNAVGKNEMILQYLPAYASYIEKLVGSSPLLMARRTFENTRELLGNKSNIVIARNEKYHSSKARTYSNLGAALKACQNEKRVFIIGSAVLFQKALPRTIEIYRLCIKAQIKSKNYYPEIDTSEFDLESAECLLKDQQNRYDYCIEKWVRIEPSGNKK